MAIAIDSGGNSALVILMRQRRALVLRLNRDTDDSASVIHCSMHHAQRRGLCPVSLPVGALDVKPLLLPIPLALPLALPLAISFALVIYRLPGGVDVTNESNSSFCKSAGAFDIDCSGVFASSAANSAFFMSDGVSGAGDLFLFWPPEASSCFGSVCSGYSWLGLV